MENKQTAVEWLVEYLRLHRVDLKNEALNNVINIAKEMEKQQIMDAYNNGDNRSAELYYNETFKSE